MNWNPTYIKAAEVCLPSGYNVETAFHSMLEGQVFYSKVQANPHPEFFPAMLFEPRLTDFYTSCFQVANALLPKLGIRQFEPDTQLIFCSTKGDIDAKTVEEKKLWFSAKRIQEKLGLNPLPIVVSSACISGVSGIGLAARMLQNKSAKRVLVLGADVFSEFTFSGFHAFKALSTDLCRPFDKDRSGLNLGEGFAAVLIDTEPENALAEICGFAQSNDANHISGPSRDGSGLKQAIERTLSCTQVKPDEVDLLCAHGTATLYNDEMESLAFESLAIDAPLISFKCYTGHTLGASGVIETVLGLEAMKQRKIPANLHTTHPGTTGKINVSNQTLNSTMTYMLKTASGFGGCNAALLLKNMQ